MFLKQRNLINGAGAYLYLGDRNDIKFSQKQFKEKLNTNMEFRAIFNSVVLEEMKTMLSETYTEPEEIDEEYSSSTDDILNMIQNVA